MSNFEIKGQPVQVDKQMVIEWAKHPVTRLIALVIAAEVAHRLVINYGFKLMGLAEAE